MEFEYKAIDKNGKMVSDSSEARSRSEMLHKLQEQGMTVLDLQQVAMKSLEDKKQGQIQFNLEFGVSQKTLVFFTRQFASTLNAGLPILRCLTILQRQTISKNLNKILADISQKIQQGKGLHEAMKDHNPPFNSIYLSMIKVGETTGNLAGVMKKLADHLEYQYNLKRKIKSALSYPIFILIFSMIMAYLMVTYLLPTFTPIFKDSGLNIKEQYPVTQFLINMSDFVQHKWFLPLVIGIIVALYLIYRYVVSNPGTKLVFDKTKFNFPFLQGFIQMQIFAQVSDSMSNLLSSGINVMESIKLVAEATDNLLVRKALKEVGVQIEKGVSFSTAVANSGIFPMMLVQMVAVGEETGNLDEQFAHISQFYENELENSLNSLTSLIEPVMIVFVGIAVFFFIIGVLLPIMGISQAYQQQM